MRNLITRAAIMLITMPTIIPAKASTRVSRRMARTMYNLDAPSDFKMPISRVRSITAVYMDWKITIKPMTTAMPMTTAINLESMGMLSADMAESHSPMDMML